MFPFQLAATLMACGGEPAEKPVPHAEPEPTEAPAPAPEPAGELAPLEVELETNQMTCLGNADCTVVDLDCCCGHKVVASNKSSAEAVAAKHKRPAEACASVECKAEECAKPAAECVDFKCALVE
ncbi:MAG: hypothetical protein H6737_20140 [Alphaproteobacteria bacterium]|nr:hypothetical protein [Alphaproteobacteria bacterium]